MVCRRVFIIAILTVAAQLHISSALASNLCLKVLSAARGRELESPPGPGPAGPTALATNSIGGIGRVGRYDVMDVQLLIGRFDENSAALAPMIESLPKMQEDLEEQVRLFTRQGVVKRSKWPDPSERALVAERIRAARDFVRRYQHRLVELEALTLQLSDQILDLRDTSLDLTGAHLDEIKRIEGLTEADLDHDQRYLRLQGLIEQGGIITKLFGSRQTELNFLERQVRFNAQMRERWESQWKGPLEQSVGRAEALLRRTGDQVYEGLFRSFPNSGQYIWEYADVVDAGELGKSDSLGTRFIQARRDRASIDAAKNRALRNQ